MGPTHRLPQVANPDDPELLSADDARILNLESEAITGHTLKLVILEPRSRPFDMEVLKKTVGQRLSTQPRATQCVDTGGSSAALCPITSTAPNHSGRLM